jgi:molybdate-binding protein/DNA-binding XRE family transcriptional regulator
MADYPNKVRQLRQERGVTQARLAAQAGLSRQSIGAIEAGRSQPAVDVALRLAAALDCSVETLFSPAASTERLAVEAEGEARTGRSALAYLDGRWVSYPLRDQLHISADALGLAARHGRAYAEPLRGAEEARDNVVILGCAAGLGLLADRLNARAGPGRFLWLNRSSHAALAALREARTHIAGVHLVDAASGEANLADVQRSLCHQSVVLIALGSWEAGLLLAPRCAKRIRSVADLTGRGLRLALRESGSGARRLLESELSRTGIPLDAVQAAGPPHRGHLDVARAIALGAADAGIATRDAALAFDLPFLPLAEERYDLVIPRDSLSDPRIQRLLDTMTGASFRRELASLGYDMRQCGQRIAELRAA